MDLQLKLDCSRVVNLLFIKYLASGILSQQFDEYECLIFHLYQKEQMATYVTVTTFSYCVPRSAIHTNS